MLSKQKASLIALLEKNCINPAWIFMGWNSTWLYFATWHHDFCV